MTRHALIFCACFLIGAVITAAIRTARHQPYAAPQALPAADAPDPQTASSPPAHPTPADPTPVNTICAICGMPVNATLPTATYQGRTIGFGCRACPPKFAADPDRYGPASLQNRVVEE